MRKKQATNGQVRTGRKEQKVTYVVAKREARRRKNREKQS